MSKRMLIALDGSDRSFKALEFAADWAATEHARVLLVHVVPEGGMPEGLRRFAAAEHVSSPPEWLYAEAVAERILKSARERLTRVGIADVECIVCQGDPAERLIETATEHDVDVIVLGTRGLGNLKSMLLGSVAQEVTNRAPCTVVTVR